MKVAETYVQMKERHQKEVNEFPMMWAFKARARQGREIGRRGKGKPGRVREAETENPAAQEKGVRGRFHAVDVVGVI